MERTFAFRQFSKKKLWKFISLKPSLKVKKRVKHKIPDSGPYWAMSGGYDIDRKLEHDAKIINECLDIEDIEEEDETENFKKVNLFYVWNNKQ